ncbi:MAG: DUF507 family protein [Nitrospinae bacterium]|nr:DUF507 family protein [Nitrospinota bacterium]
MKLSREKINHLSKLILKGLLEDDRVEFFCEENDLRLDIVDILREEIEIEEQIDDAVRKVISTYSRDIREGSNEWDILYHKHYNEETKRRRGLSLG